MNFTKYAHRIISEILLRLRPSTLATKYPCYPFNAEGESACARVSGLCTNTIRVGAFFLLLFEPMRNGFNFEHTKASIFLNGSISFDTFSRQRLNYYDYRPGTCLTRLFMWRQNVESYWEKRDEPTNGRTPESSLRPLELCCLLRFSCICAK